MDLIKRLGECFDRDIFRIVFIAYSFKLKTINVIPK